MIAEDYFSITDMGVAASGAAAGRHNRNLSSIVSTIRDDGPSGAELLPVSHQDGPADTGEASVDATTADETPFAAETRQRIRPVPGLAVLSKAAVALLLLVVAGGAALLAAGRYPLIDGHGLQLARLPVGALAEIRDIRGNAGERFTQWAGQVKQLFAGVTPSAADGRIPGTTELAGVAARQQEIMQRLGALAAVVDSLQLRFEREQAERHTRAVTYRTEQDLQLDAVQAQLAGLQQQIAGSRAALPAPPEAGQTGKVAKASPPAGDWVVNVASSSHERSIRQLQDKLRGQGVETGMQRVEGKDAPRYRLRVSGFSSSGAAKRYADRLVQEFDLKGAWASKR